MISMGPAFFIGTPASCANHLGKIPVVGVSDSHAQNLRKLEDSPMAGHHTKIVGSISRGSTWRFWKSSLDGFARRPSVTLLSELATVMKVIWG